MMFFDGCVSYFTLEISGLLDPAASTGRRFKGPAESEKNLSGGVEKNSEDNSEK
jgi:hypothetical protein